MEPCRPLFAILPPSPLCSFCSSLWCKIRLRHILIPWAIHFWFLQKSVFQLLFRNDSELHWKLQQPEGHVTDPYSDSLPHVASLSVFLALTSFHFKRQLQSNEFSGSIPSSLTKLTSLENLYAHSPFLSCCTSKRLGFAFLSTWGWWTDFLRFLSNNHLSGTLPNGLGNLTKLVGLYEFSFLPSDRSFAKSIWMGYDDLVQISSVETNSLTGTFPAEFTKLSALSDLYLTPFLRESNLIRQICGGTKWHWHSCRSLESNMLTGSLPDFWEAMTSLSDLWDSSSIDFSMLL